ncbi:MAG: hypothetical protein ABIQ16_23035 [Polyangiaceae bacterium]
MSHFPHPHDSSKTKPLPETPRWQKRHLGLLAAIVVFGLIAAAAWHYRQRTPPPAIVTPGLPTQPE